MGRQSGEEAPASSSGAASGIEQRDRSDLARVEVGRAPCGGRWGGGRRRGGWREALGSGGDGERRRGDGDGPIRSGSDERERRGSGEVVAVVGSGGVRVSGQGGGVAYRPGDGRLGHGPVGPRVQWGGGVFISPPFHLFLDFVFISFSFLF